jgi:hypothetical protein
VKVSRAAVKVAVAEVVRIAVAEARVHSLLSKIANPRFPDVWELVYQER